MLSGELYTNPLHRIRLSPMLNNPVVHRQWRSSAYDILAWSFNNSMIGWLYIMQAEDRPFLARGLAASCRGGRCQGVVLQNEPLLSAFQKLKHLLYCDRCQCCVAHVPLPDICDACRTFRSASPL